MREDVLGEKYCVLLPEHNYVKSACEEAEAVFCNKEHGRHRHLLVYRVIEKEEMCDRPDELTSYDESLWNAYCHHRCDIDVCPYRQQIKELVTEAPCFTGTQNLALYIDSMLIEKKYTIYFDEAIDHLMTVECEFNPKFSAKVGGFLKKCDVKSSHKERSKESRKSAKEIDTDSERVDWLNDQIYEILCCDDIDTARRLADDLRVHHQLVDDWNDDVKNCFIDLIDNGMIKKDYLPHVLGLVDALTALIYDAGDGRVPVEKCFLQRHKHIYICALNKRLQNLCTRAKKVVFLNATTNYDKLGAFLRVKFTEPAKIKANHHIIQYDDAGRGMSSLADLQGNETTRFDLDTAMMLGIIDSSPNAQILIVCRRSTSKYNIAGKIDKFLDDNKIPFQAIRVASDRDADLVERVVREYWPLSSTNRYKHFDIEIVIGSPVMPDDLLKIRAGVLGITYQTMMDDEKAGIIQSLRSRNPDKITYLLTSTDVGMAGIEHRQYEDPLEDSINHFLKRISKKGFLDTRKIDDDDCAAIEHLEAEGTIAKDRTLIGGKSRVIWRLTTDVPLESK